MTDLASDVATRAKRLLICSAGVPHESNGASVVLFYHYVDCLRRAGYQVLHLLLLEGTVWGEGEVADYQKKMVIQSDFTVAVARSQRFVEQNRLSLQLNWDALSQSIEQCRAFCPDAIVAFDIVSAWALSNIDAKCRIIWLGDLNFQTIWFHSIYSAREKLRSIVHIPSIWLLCRTWKKLYARILRDASNVIVASASSQAELEGLQIKSQYEPYPWPEAGSVPFERRVPAQPTFMFFGNLVGLGSRSALHLMVDAIYPRLVRFWGAHGFKILIAGRGDIPDWFVAAISDKEEIQRLGFVPDIDDLMAQCHAVLAPIDVPVGNRSRILTAMAKGALVVAHSNVALGNPDLVDGVTCYLASDADGFVERMRVAFEDEERARTIIRNAQRCYRERFHPDRAAPRLLDKLKQCLG